MDNTSEGKNKVHPPLLVDFFMSKEINTIICDFDGTLANEKGAVSPSNINAGKEWEKKGKLVLATGAQYDYVKHFCKVAPVLAVIAEGGAKTLSPSGETLRIETIDPDIIRAIKYELKEREIPYFAEAENTIYAQDGIALFNTDASRFQDLEKMPNKGIIRIELWPEIDDKARIDRFIRKASRNSNINVERAWTNHAPYQEAWQITSSQATKFHGVKKLLLKPKINLDQTAAIGNGDNDILLLENVRNEGGFSVAIGDSPQRVKRAANAVTLPQSENGVEHVIYRFMEERRK